MKVRKKPNVTVRALVAGYQDLEEKGVTGYNRNLDIRPAYQREFIYKNKQRDEVIRSVLKDMPLGIMYWARTDSDNPPMYEVIDGQQRIISLCQFVNGDFSVDEKFIFNYQKNFPEIFEKFLDYELIVYECKGAAEEKLKWFEVINKPGAQLTKQELRNAVYSGTWLSDAKVRFSKSSGNAQDTGKGFISGRAIRQEHLETVLTWIADSVSANNIEEYMSQHAQDPDAKELWDYFENVINWAKELFGGKPEKGMEQVPWGKLYNEYNGKVQWDIPDLREKVQKLRMDEEVTKKSGIYRYVLNPPKNEKWLNIRTFTANQKSTMYAKQQGVCPKCDPGKKYDLKEMEADHKTPWSQGGKTELSNCQLLCKEHNREKSNI